MGDMCLFLRRGSNSNHSHPGTCPVCLHMCCRDMFGDRFDFQYNQEFRVHHHLQPPLQPYTVNYHGLDLNSCQMLNSTYIQGDTTYILIHHMCSEPRNDPLCLFFQIMKFGTVWRERWIFTIGRPVKRPFYTWAVYWDVYWNHLWFQIIYWHYLII